MSDKSAGARGRRGSPVLDPARVLAWSESRVDGPDSARPAIALWRPAGTTVAIGLAQKPEIELNVEAMRRDNVGLVRRQSGGGAVLLYPGVLCWEAWGTLDAVAAAMGDSGIRPSYAFFCLPVMDGLAALGAPAARAGICDVSIPGAGEEGLRKIAGTAQLRRRAVVLVHGCLLVAPDMDLLARYLRFPSDQPDYRRGRSHRDFCLSLAEYFAAGKTGCENSENLIRQVGDSIGKEAEKMGWDVLVPPAEPDAAMLALENGKYRSDGWNWKKERRVGTDNLGGVE